MTRSESSPFSPSRSLPNFCILDARLSPAINTPNVSNVTNQAKWHSRDHPIQHYTERCLLRLHDGLAKFAGETGGATFLPRFLSTNMKDPLQNAGNARRNEETLSRIFTQLPSELRAQYLIQYYSEADYPANKFVKVNVALTNQPTHRVRTREGYYVKK